MATSSKGLRSFYLESIRKSSVALGKDGVAKYAKAGYLTLSPNSRPNALSKDTPTCPPVLPPNPEYSILVFLHSCAAHFDHQKPLTATTPSAATPSSPIEPEHLLPLSKPAPGSLSAARSNAIAIRYATSDARSVRRCAPCVAVLDAG